jgi:ribose/xylose/arabinose/galactoside ABC-type transport system permease subunit
MSSIDIPQAKPATSKSDVSHPRGARPKWLHYLSFTNMSVVYAEIALIIIFSLWAPHTFPTWTTVKSVLNGSAIAGLMALSLVVPLSARIFDLSVGEAMGLANMLIARLLVDKGWGVVPAIAVTLLAGVGMGLFNALVVVRARIDSLIGTPGIGSPYLLNAYAAAFLGATQFGGRFNAWGTVLAVILLGTGTSGLFLVGGAAWTQSMFTGVVLLLALGASNLERAVQARSWIRAKRAPNGPAGTSAP